MRDAAFSVDGGSSSSDLLFCAVNTSGKHLAVMHNVFFVVLLPVILSDICLY